MDNERNDPLPNARECRRMRAWELHQQGWSQRRIAAELGVTQGAVYQWLKSARDQGVDALRAQPHPGPRAALTAEQVAQLPALIARGADAYGFQDSRWTLKRAAAVIEQVFGVSYHPAHVSRLLRKYAPGWRKTRNET